MDVPREVIFRHAFREASDYFASRIEEKRREGQVAILVQKPADTLYFMPCNEKGYPNYYQLKALHIPYIAPMLVASDLDALVTQDLRIEEITIFLEKPLLSYRYDYMEQPTIFMWEGREMNRERIPIEKMNISELMRVAQAAIGKREGIIVDEALKNKIYK